VSYEKASQRPAPQKSVIGKSVIEKSVLKTSATKQRHIKKCRMKKRHKESVIETSAVLVDLIQRSAVEQPLNLWFLYMRQFLPTRVTEKAPALLLLLLQVSRVLGAL